VTDPAGKASFLANAAWFDAIHPDWYALEPDARSVRPILAVDDAEVLAAAARSGTQVIPMVASVEDIGWTRAMLATPESRAAHVQVLVDTAVAHGYAGLDLDYEHLQDTSDGPPLQAFVAAFAAAMHAAGKRASMAVPAEDAPGVVWSYPVLAASLDQVHLMGYDFHYVGSHGGPTAPLGWIDGVAAQAAASGHPERFLLGLPNYGLSANAACVLTTCAARCTSAIATATTHMQTCPFGNLAPGRILNCDSSDGPLYFDDTASLAEKVASAQAHGLGGVTYWTVGAEPPGFFDMVRTYY
jgi:spore germination protein YaaH